MEWKNKQQLNEFLELEKTCKEDSKLQPSSNQLADTNVTEFVINVSLPSPSRMVRQTQSLFKDILFLSSLSASSWTLDVLAVSSSLAVDAEGIAHAIPHEYLSWQ